MKRHTVIVEGTLAFRMQRVAAARAGDHGRDVATLPLLAARLAGGFSRPADHTTLVPIVARALAELLLKSSKRSRHGRAWRGRCLRALAARVGRRHSIRRSALCERPAERSGAHRGLSARASADRRAAASRIFAIARLRASHMRQATVGHSAFPPVDLHRPALAAAHRGPRRGRRNHVGRARHTRPKLVSRHDPAARPCSLPNI